MTLNITREEWFLDKARNLRKQLDEEEAERLAIENANKPDTKPKAKQKTRKAKPSNNPPITISQTIDYWEIDRVEYQNGIHQVKLSKALLDNGDKKTQDGWVEYRIKANEKGEFYTADMPLHHSIFTALSKSNSDESQEAREFIRKSMNSRKLTTLTRIIYTPQGQDKIIHNYKIPNEQYELNSNFVGKDGFIKDINPTQYLEELLGTKDIAEINKVYQSINKVYQSINQTDAYIYRLNSKPNFSMDERTALFDTNSDTYPTRIRFNCHRDISILIPHSEYVSNYLRFNP